MFLRFVGIVCLLTIFVLSGYNKIVNTKEAATYLSKSNFPFFFAKVIAPLGINYKLTSADYTLLIQATGGIFIAFSGFIFLGVGRRFFSFLLAVGLVFITACFHVDVKNPAATKEAEMIHALKNLAIIGGLLIVASGSRRVEKVVVEAPKTKKMQ